MTNQVGISSKIAPREAFIGAMRRVATCVTVVTTDGPGGRYGATVSAFSSVSADPPTILVCLKSESRIARAVAVNGTLCVNVLPQGGADIAKRFAGFDDAVVRDRFDGIDHYGKLGTPPTIDGATVFSCSLQQNIVVGSHLIFVGKVNEVRDGMNEPLAYLAGAYQRVVPTSEVSDVARPV